MMPFPVISELNYTWVWPAIRQLFSEQGFLTVVCAVLIISMTIRFYKFIRSVHPMLVPLIMLLMVCILIFHWTQTRTEPKIFTPAVDFAASILPTPPDQGKKAGPAGKAAPGKAAPGKPASPPAKK